MMANVWAVIRREYLQRVRSKWFIITTVGGPLFMIAIMVLPAYFAARGEQNERRIVVVDRTEVLYDRLAPRMDEAGYDVTSEPWTSDAVPALTQRATDGDIGAFIVLDDETLASGKAMFYGTDRPSPIRRIGIRSAIVQSALEQQLEGAGVDARALLQGGDLQIEVLSDEGAGMDDPRFLVAYMGAFFLYMVILLYAVSVMRATLEEKTSRVVEIVISSMKPWHLMLGKMLGVGAVGLTQMAVWLGSGAIMASVGLPAIMAARPEMSGLSQIQEVLPGLGLLMLFLGFFVFGFFMFSGLYAAVGAMCNTEEEAQQAQFPVIMLLIVPILFVMNVIQNPTTPLSVGLSLFPFFSPVLMWARVAGGGAPAWQIALSFVLMGAATLAVAWLAGRIYKVGILMAGKRPTLPELWRWMREA
jgi:ABC-2 type transport system permease protein